MGKQKITDIKMNFTGGEISPLLSVRTDMEVLTRSVKEAKNIEISPYGGIRRRGGFSPYLKIGNTANGYVFDLINIQSFEVDEETKIIVVLSSRKNNAGEVSFDSLKFFRYNKNYVIGKYNSNIMIVQDNREDKTFTFSKTNFNVNEVNFTQNGNNLVLTHKDQKPIIIKYNRNLGTITMEDLNFVNIPQFSFFDQYSPNSTQDTHSLIIKLDNKWIFENENGDREKRRSPTSRNYKFGFDGEVSNEIVFNSLSNYNPNNNTYIPVDKNTNLYFFLKFDFRGEFPSNVFKRKTFLKDRWTGAEIPIEFEFEIPEEMLYDEAEATPARLEILKNNIESSIYDSIYRLFFSTSQIFNNGTVITDLIEVNSFTAEYYDTTSGSPVDGNLSGLKMFFHLNNPVINYQGTTYTFPALAAYERQADITFTYPENSVSLQVVDQGLNLTPALHNPALYYTAFNYLSFYKEFSRLNLIKDLNNFYFETLPFEYVIDNNNNFNVMNITFSLFGVDALEYPVITGEWVGSKFWQGEDSYIRSKKLYNANSFLEDAFSERRGWPTAAIFLENRLVLGGSRSLPNMIWASRQGDFYNFGNFDGRDDEALLNISTNTNAIKYLLGQKSLQVFTDNSEHYNPNALTTKEITLPQQSNEGCATIKPVFIDNATFFIDKNKRALRMFIYNDLEQSYKTTNISLEAAHLISGKEPVAMTARQTETSNFVYILNKDNTITVMNTIRDQEIKSFYSFESFLTFKGAGVVDNKLFTAGYHNSNSELILYIYDERIELDNVYVYNKFDAEWNMNGKRSIEELPKPADKTGGKYTIKSYPWKIELDLFSSGFNFYEVDNLMVASKYNSIAEAEQFYTDYVNSGYYPSENTPTIYNFINCLFNRYLGLDYDVYIISQDYTGNIGTGEKMGELKRVCKATIHCYNTTGWYLTYAKKEYIIDNKRNTTSDTNILGESALFPAKTNGDKLIMLQGYIKRDGVKLEQKLAFAGGFVQGYTLTVKLEV